MRKRGEAKYFIVKHGLDSFEALPNYVWRSDKGPAEEPKGFKGIHIGDKWIAFAYTSGDKRENPLSLITGFYECTEASVYRKIPLTKIQLEELHRTSGKVPGAAWMIEGRDYPNKSKQLKHHVAVRPIDELLGRRHFTQTTFISISAEEFETIRAATLASQLAPSQLPLLGREPCKEQELLAMVAHAHKQFGISKILKVQIRFPDLEVEIQGHNEPVYLELETYSKNFIAHRHADEMSKGLLKTDKRPVAVLCWIDNDKKNGTVKKLVHKVYELRSLIRDGKKIKW